MAFAYGGHNVVLEIQATLPHPPSTVKPMMKGVYVAYVVVLWCYFSVSVRALCFFRVYATARKNTCIVPLIIYMFWRVHAHLWRVSYC